MVFALCVLVVIAVFQFWPGEPEYAGMRLSEWLAVQGNRPTEASDAIRAMGTNALPVLVNWVEYETPQWRYGLANEYYHVPRFFYSDSVLDFLAGRKAKMRSFNSTFAFRVLGTNASAAIPELSRFVTDPQNQNRQSAALALAYIGGPQALPPLLSVIQDKRTSFIQRNFIAGIIPELNYRGPELSNAVPAMIAFLQNTNSSLQPVAASVLGTFLIQPEQCVPALISALESPNNLVRRHVIIALGNFGRDATNAIKAISIALNDSDGDVRRSATNALFNIAPEVLTNGVNNF